jgi:hypothetical protein
MTSAQVFRPGPADSSPLGRQLLAADAGFSAIFPRAIGPAVAVYSGERP